MGGSRRGLYTERKKLNEDPDGVLAHLSAVMTPRASKKTANVGAGEPGNSVALPIDPHHSYMDSDSDSEIDTDDDEEKAVALTQPPSLKSAAPTMKAYRPTAMSASEAEAMDRRCSIAMRKKLVYAGQYNKFRMPSMQAIQSMTGEQLYNVLEQRGLLR